MCLVREAEGGQCAAACGDDAKVTLACKSLGATGGEDFWPTERRPFKLEELFTEPKEGVSFPRDGALSLSGPHQRGLLSPVGSMTYTSEEPGPGGQSSRFEASTCCVTLGQFLTLSDSPIVLVEGLILLFWNFSF